LWKGGETMESVLSRLIHSDRAFINFGNIVNEHFTNIEAAIEKFNTNVCTIYVLTTKTIEVVTAKLVDLEFRNRISVNTITYPLAEIKNVIEDIEEFSFKKTSFQDAYRKVTIILKNDDPIIIDLKEGDNYYGSDEMNDLANFVNKLRKLV
jgi:hypothetical protein